MRRGCIVTAILASWLAAPAAAEWPQWRGPNANGISAEKDPPIVWGPSQNIAWKVPLEGVGTSTPIVSDGQVIVTMQIGKNELQGTGRIEGVNARAAPDSPDGIVFIVKSFSQDDGSTLWEYRLAADDPLPPTHQKHNLASPSCVTDGRRVYAWMGTGQIVALTMDGERVWSRHIGREYAPFNIRWGHGSSPVLYKGSLLLLCDHQDNAYLVALDKNTGTELWKADREKTSRSYTTPLLITASDDQVIINSSRRIDAYDPATGRLMWYVGEPNRVPVSTPVVHDGVLYTSRGYRSGPYMAVKLDGSGGADENILWRVPTGAPYVSSLLHYDGLIYMATENGIASCVDAANGKTLWRQRLGGYFSASPIAAAGKIYMVNESGVTFVLASGREYHLISKNDLGERTMASPAIAGGRILLRTDNHLYAVGE